MQKLLDKDGSGAVEFTEVDELWKTAKGIGREAAHVFGCLGPEAVEMI